MTFNLFLLTASSIVLPGDLHRKRVRPRVCQLACPLTSSSLSDACVAGQQTERIICVAIDDTPPQCTPVRVI